MNHNPAKKEQLGARRSRREFLLASGIAMTAWSLGELSPPRSHREESRERVRIRAIMERYGSEFGAVRSTT